MRKVTQQIKDAWEAGEERTIGNTYTDGKSVYLHSNEIIRRNDDGTVQFTNAGWPTRLTHERLGGILPICVFRREWLTHVCAMGDWDNAKAMSDGDWYNLEDYATC